MTTTPAPQGADIEQYRAGFEAWWTTPHEQTGRAPCSFMDEQTAKATWAAAKRESGSSTSTSQGAAPDGFAKVLTEEQIIAAWDAQWRYHGHEPCKVGHVEFGRTVEVMVATRCRAEGGNTSNESVCSQFANPEYTDSRLGAALGDALDAAKVGLSELTAYTGSEIAAIYSLRDERFFAESDVAWAIAAIQANAVRYRWLRDYWDGKSRWQDMELLRDGGADMDAGIDSAIAASTTQQEKKS